jgi:hypothetical protein
VTALGRPRNNCTRNYRVPYVKKHAVVRKRNLVMGFRLEAATYLYKAKPGAEDIRNLNFAVVRSMSIQVTKLPL